MAPNSAMKVPVFSILLSPSSPRITPSGSVGGREGDGWMERGVEKEEGERQERS